MNAGLISQVDQEEWSCTLTTSLSRTSNAKGAIARASNTSLYTYSYAAELTGVAIELETEVAAGSAVAAGTASADFTLWGNTHTETIGGGFASSIVGKIQVDNRRLFVELVSGLLVWVVRWDEIRFLVGGSTIHTIAAGEYGTELLPAAPFLAPSGDPTACMPIIGGSAAMNPALVYGTPAESCSVVSAYSLRLETDWSGGHRVEIDGVWHTQPVVYSPVSAPTISCAVSASLGTASVTTTNDAAGTSLVGFSDETVLFETLSCDECTNGPAHTPAVYDHFVRTVSYETKTPAVKPLEALSKSMMRMGDASLHGEGVYRFGMPQTLSYASAVCFDWEAGMELSSSVVETEVHPSRSDFLAWVGGDVHEFEDVFDDISYCGYELGGFKFVGKKSCFVLTSPGSCPLPGEGDPVGSIIFCGTPQDQAVSHTVSALFPVVEDRDSNEDIDQYLDTAAGYSRYLNTVVNPHWSFHTYIPANDLDLDGDGIDDAQDEWPLDSGPIADEYYLDNRTQWARHPALPDDEDRRTRNSLISAPARDGIFRWIEKTRVGAETSWWGISRFIAQEVVQDSSKALTSESEPAWTFDDCSAIFGSSIAVTADPGETTAVLHYDLGRFSERPYLYPHICDRIKVAWSGARIAAVRLYVVDQSGRKVELGTVSGTIYRRPLTAQSPMYAGSWGQDFGQAYIDDVGSDALSAGASLATMASAERVFAFMLLPGQLSKELRIEIDLDTPGASCTLEYPRFYAGDERLMITHEQGHHSNVVWPDGPGVRWGNWAWYDDDAEVLLSTPKVFGPGFRETGGWKSSAIDWLCFANTVLRGQAMDYNLAAQIASMFDTHEGTTAGDLDTFTISFMTDKKQNNTLSPLAADLLFLGMN